MIRAFASFIRDTRGAVVIETAFVTPVLVLMSIGAYQVSEIVARQHELQAGADEAMSITLGGWSNTTDQLTALKGVIQRSTGVSASNITAVLKYRCGTSSGYVTDKSVCGSTDIVSTFVSLHLTDTYVPAWRSFGVGSDITLTVDRMVQIS